MSVYRPPSNSYEDNSSLLEFFRNCLSGRELVVLGDFNLPTLCWPLDDHAGRYASPVDRLFRECFVELGWSQWVQFGTFIPSGNTLDLIFTTETDRVFEVFSSEPLPGCHHTPVYCSLIFQWDPPTDNGSNERNRDWARGNYEFMSSELAEYDWYYLFHDASVDTCYKILLDILGIHLKYSPEEPSENFRKLK